MGGRIGNIFRRQSPAESDPRESYEQPEPEHEEQPDPWEGLDDETRSRIEEYANQRATEEIDAVREGLGGLGFDIGHDYQPVLKDPTRLRSYAEPLLRAAPPETSPQQPQQPPPAPVEQMPDPYTDPEGFQEWNRRQIRAEAEKIAEERLKPIQDRTEQESMRTRALAVRDALQYVPDALDQFAPQLEEWLEDPRFEAAMTEAMMTVDPTQWNSYANLAKLASVVAVDLMQQPEPRTRSNFRPPQARAADGRFQAAPAQGGYAPRRPARPQREEEEEPQQFPSGRRQARAAFARAQLPISGPSRDGGRQQREREYDEVARLYAERQGISVAEAQALLDDPSGDSASSMRNKRLERLR